MIKPIRNVHKPNFANSNIKSIIIDTIITVRLRFQLPWRKYRIKIHSETIRAIPIHFDICIRANANYSEPIRKTFRISFDEKQSKINPINSEKSIRMNPKPSFQSR